MFIPLSSLRFVPVCFKIKGSNSIKSSGLGNTFLHPALHLQTPSGKSRTQHVVNMLSEVYYERGETAQTYQYTKAYLFSIFIIYYF